MHILLSHAYTDLLTVTDRLPCQHKVVHFLCTPPTQRTGSIPSCVCACAGPPRGLDQSVGTSPDPQSWDSAPSSLSATREAGAPGERGLCICLSNTTPSSGPPPKITEARRGVKTEKRQWGWNVKTLRALSTQSWPCVSPEKQEQSDPVLGLKKSQALHFAGFLFFFSWLETKSGVIPSALEPGSWH